MQLILSFSLYVGSGTWPQLVRLAQQMPLLDEPLTSPHLTLSQRQMRYLVEFSHLLILLSVYGNSMQNTQASLSPSEGFHFLIVIFHPVIGQGKLNIRFNIIVIIYSRN